MNFASISRRWSALVLAVVLTLLLGSPVASQEAEDDAFTFAVLGHLRGRDDGVLNELLDELIDEVDKLEPDMVFLTGDLVWGWLNKPDLQPDVVEQDWEELDARLGRLGVPVYRVPGNHDINYPETRDIYLDRYGELPQAVRYGNSLFILLNSTALPEGNNLPPFEYFRGKPLDSAQIDFIREQLAAEPAPDHVFLFMHQLLYWSEDDSWWEEVHPLLVGKNVRAVFSGEHGPLKFSHVRRDEIDYIQTGIEDDYAVDNPLALERLAASEYDRQLAQQFDNFLMVTVDGPEVTIGVETVGAISSGKFSPQRWRQINGDVGHRAIYPEKSLAERLSEFLEQFRAIFTTSRRVALLLLVLTFIFLSGVAVSTIWHRWRAAR